MSKSQFVPAGGETHPGDAIQVASYVGTSLALTLIQEAALFYTDALQNPESLRAQDGSDVVKKLGHRLAYPLFRSAMHAGLCNAIWVGLHDYNKPLSKRLFNPTVLLPRQRSDMIKRRGQVTGRVVAANQDAVRALYLGAVPSVVGIGIDWVEIAAEYLTESARINKQKKHILDAERDPVRKAKKESDMERRVGELRTEHLLWAGRVVLRSAKYQLSQGVSTWASSILFGTQVWATHAETLMGLIGSALLA